jgi:hypothetical protein
VPSEANSETLRSPDEPSITMPSSRIENDTPAPPRFTKDDMKKTKRLSIEFRHREVTITVEGSTLHVQDSEPDAASAPAACPACGSPWITAFTRAAGDVPAGVDQIHRALRQSGMHAQVSPAGLLRICQRSFEELKEKF